MSTDLNSNATEPNALEPKVAAVPAPDTPPRRKKPPPRPDHCLNCGRAAEGNFCAHCGQEIKDHTVALRPLLADLLAEIASWDSKLLRTMTALVFRPGFLTNEYNAGRRVPYLSPLKLYLTISVLFFLVLSWKAPLSQWIMVNPGGVSQSAHTGKAASPEFHTLAEYAAYQKTLPPPKQDGLLARLMVQRLLKAQHSPQGFARALLDDIPKMMFLLLPLFAVSLKLLYLRTKRLYVEHLIFLLHVHAFAFLALTLLLLAHPDWLIGVVCLALLAYIAAALRVVYKQSWPKTLLKFSLLGFGYLFLLSLCIAGTALTALWLF